MPDIFKVAIVTRQVAKTTGAARITLAQSRLFHENGCAVDMYGEKLQRENILETGARPIKVPRWPLSGYQRRKFFSWYCERQLRRKHYNLVVGHGDLLHQDIVFLHNCVHLGHEKMYGRPLPASNDTGRIHSQFLGDKNYRLLIANSHLMKKDLMARFGDSSDRIEVHYPGYNPLQFNPGDKQKYRDEMRVLWKVRTDEKVIGLVTSGDFAKRDVRFFLTSIAALPPQTRQSCRFIVVGKDNSRQIYMDLAQELGIAHQLLILEPISDVQRYYHALDVFVLPAKIEEFGLSVLEAMACGLPVITNTNVGAAELLSERSRSWVCRPDHPGDFLEYLQLLIERKDLRETSAEMNLQVAQQWTEAKQGERLIRLLRGRKFLPQTFAQ